MHIASNEKDEPVSGDTPLLTVTDLELLFEEIPRDIYACPGQLSFYDRLIYYWAGKCFYRGCGVIIDSGALVGGTALLLAHGLANNLRIKDRRDRIFSYDLFEDKIDGFMVQGISRMLPETEFPVLAGGIVDFEPLYRKTVERYADFVQVRRGDISDLGYTELEPIEILSIDVGKTPALMRSVAIDFFPHLITDGSIVLNQDLMFAFQPWVIIAMEMMGDFFIKVLDPPTETTTIHRPVRSISAEDVERCIPEDYFSLENLRYIDSAIARATSPANRVTLRAAQIHGYWLLGRHLTAQEVARQMVDEYNLTGHHFLRKPSLKRLFEQMNMPVPDA